MNLILCGLPRSGKSRVGELLAKELDRPFIDSDSLIETAYMQATGEQLACAEIYRMEGERAFRYLEKKVILSLKGAEESIIAVGGGALADRENRDLLKALGKLLYLKVDTGAVLERILEEKIPAFCQSEEQFRKLAESRIPQYEEAADFAIACGSASPEELALKIRELVNG